MAILFKKLNRLKIIRLPIHNTHRDILRICRDTWSMSLSALVLIIVSFETHLPFWLSRTRASFSFSISKNLMSPTDIVFLISVPVMNVMRSPTSNKSSSKLLIDILWRTKKNSSNNSGNLCTSDFQLSLMFFFPKNGTKNISILSRCFISKRHLYESHKRKRCLLLPGLPSQSYKRGSRFIR